MHVVPVSIRGQGALSRMNVMLPSGDDRKYRLLMSAVTGYAIYMLDTDGHVVSWDAGAQRAKGYSRNEILGQHFSVFYTEEDRRLRRPQQGLEAARRDGRFESEGWRVRKDGTRFWASAVLDVINDEDGNFVGFAKVTRDMTARHNAQQAQLETERRFRLLVRGVTDYAIYSLDLDGYIENWNAGGVRIKGYSADEIVGQHFSRFYTGEDQASGLPARGLQVARTAGRFADEGWRVRKDGRRFWASVVIDPIRDDDGQLIGFAKITRDLTERHSARQRLDEMRARAVHAEQLEALGRVTSGVAHDFNNLFQVVLSSARIAETMAAGNAELIGILGGIGNAAVQGSLIVKNLLTFARQAPYSPEVVDTAETLGRAMDLFGRSLGNDIQIERNLDEDVWAMRVDIAQFGAALLNVVVNARDAMPDGGILKITATNRALNGEQNGLAGTFVAIGVHDTGSGIPPEVLGRIFEPFFTTKPLGKGTGLGLSHVYDFAQQAGGTVEIASIVNHGTGVTLLLPAVPPATNCK